MTTTYVWAPTPEDPSVHWTLPLPETGDTFGTVSVVEAVGTSADYDLPHLLRHFEWAVADGASGDEHAAEREDTLWAARKAAEAAMHAHLHAA